jgi:hypothetical protein
MKYAERDGLHRKWDSEKLNVQLEGVDGTLTQTLNLDFGQPITVP